MSARAGWFRGERRCEMVNADVWMISSKVIHHRLRLAARCLMMPRFSLSARASCYSRACTLEFSRASTSEHYLRQRECLPRYSEGLYRRRYKRVTSERTCAVCRRTGLDSICSTCFFLWCSSETTSVTRVYIMTSRRRGGRDGKSPVMINERRKIKRRTRIAAPAHETYIPRIISMSRR